MSISFLRKSVNFRNWYVLDGSFGQPEGTGTEWQTVIERLKEKKPVHFRRVATSITERGDIHFFSPRNQSCDTDFVEVLAEDLPEWIRQAEETLFEPGPITETEKQTVIAALGYGLASLAAHKHQWSDDERAAYDQAIEIAKRIHVESES